MFERDPAYAALSGTAGELVVQLAAVDPMAVVRALARGMKPQTGGAKLMVVRRLCALLDDADPGCMATIAVELNQHTAGKR